MSRTKVVAVDFDGTCVAHEYPLIGKDIGAIPILKELVENNVKLVLYTMRSGKELKEAENWFKENKIDLYGSQVNPTQKLWTTSPKCYANLYIDDAALGVPLINNGKDRPYVDWKAVRELLIEKGYIDLDNEIKELIKSVRDGRENEVVLPLRTEEEYFNTLTALHLNPQHDADDEALQLSMYCHNESNYYELIGDYRCGGFIFKYLGNDDTL